MLTTIDRQLIRHISYQAVIYLKTEVIETIEGSVIGRYQEFLFNAVLNKGLMMNIVQLFLIILGFILLVLGVRLLIWKSTPTIGEPDIVDPPPVIGNGGGGTEVKVENPNWVCGRDFEEYVMRKFLEKKRWFTILNQNHDQLDPDGCPFPANSNPDLEIEAIWWATRKERIAVECKYRSKWYMDETIQWCKEHNLENYRKFSEERNMPVFVVLGVGGNHLRQTKCFALNCQQIHLQWLQNLKCKI